MSLMLFVLRVHSVRIAIFIKRFKISHYNGPESLLLVFTHSWYTYLVNFRSKKIEMEKYQRLQGYFEI